MYHSCPYIHRHVASISPLGKATLGGSLTNRTVCAAVQRSACLPSACTIYFHQKLSAHTREDSSWDSYHLVANVSSGTAERNERKEDRQEGCETRVRKGRGRCQGEKHWLCCKIRPNLQTRNKAGYKSDLYASVQADV